MMTVGEVIRQNVVVDIHRHHHIHRHRLHQHHHHRRHWHENVLFVVVVHQQHDHDQYQILKLKKFQQKQRMMNEFNDRNQSLLQIPVSRVLLPVVYRQWLYQRHHYQ